MKTILLQALFAVAISHVSIASVIPEKTEAAVQTVLKKLHEATYHYKLTKKYETTQFLNDLKQIDVTEDILKEAKNTPDIDPFLIEMLQMALNVRRPEVNKRIDEIKGWYGCYSHELPDELFEKKWKGLEEARGITLAQQREFMIQEGKIHRLGGDLEPLSDDHLKADYLPAWEFWFIAPPSKERGLILRHFREILKGLGDDSRIPLLLGAMKIELDRGEDKKDVLCAFVYDIVQFPSEDAMEALLEINRYAIENNVYGNDDFYKDDYYHSVSRCIIRSLASRRAFADQLIDPRMKELVARKGYKEKPEDVPLADDLWKKYKPLLEARLAAKTDQTPKADIELIESALDIMPKK